MLPLHPPITKRRENFPMEMELTSEEHKSNPLYRCVDIEFYSMQPLDLKLIARFPAVCSYAGSLGALALVQVMECTARYKTINYMFMSTQDCWYYDGNSIEADGNFIW